MGTALTTIWDKGHPQVKESLQSLQNWSREDIQEACAKFKHDSGLAVNLGTFMRVLGFTDRQKAEAAFNELKNNRDHVEWFAVIAAMLVMSNQKYISKTTFLFSLCDFNSSGHVNVAELCIGMRYLFMGIHRFFANATVPTRDEIEKSTIAVFAKIDTHKTDYISIGEVVAFSYMSKNLRTLLGPFPSSDERIFEDLVTFAFSSKGQKIASTLRLETQEQKMLQELRLAPHAGTHTTVSPSSQRRTQARKMRNRPWHDNSTITKPFAWLMYHLFTELQDAGLRAIPNQVLADAVGDHRRLKTLLQQFSQKAAAVDVDMNEPGHPLTLLLVLMEKHLTDKNFATRLHDHDGDAVSLHGLFCLMCPQVTEAEIDDGMRWCAAYRAHDVLSELLRYKTSPMVDAAADAPQHTLELNISEDDVLALFEAVDMDGSGEMSMQELCEKGSLPPGEARRLIELWDRSRSGELSKGDILAIVHQVHSSVRQSMKALFTESRGRPPVQSAPDLSWKAPTPQAAAK